MKRQGSILMGLAIGCLFACSASAGSVEIEGTYRSIGEDKLVTLTRLAPGIYQVHAEAWDGVGMFDGRNYWGVFQSSQMKVLGGAQAKEILSGTQAGVLKPDGALSIHAQFNNGQSFDAIWTRDLTGLAVPFQPPKPPADGAPDPKTGEYVYVEELPEAITKVQPVYPDGDHGEGTVLVQVLVGKDGHVKDTKIVKSIAVFDEAAVTAVRQWVFKPAMTKGKPVAVWVAVPVRFSRTGRG